MSVKINEKTLKITMTRGDTLITTVDIINPDTGEEYIPDPETDSLRFALKESWDDDAPVLIHKDIPVDTRVLRIESYETKDLEQGKAYCYDIEFTYNNDIVDTIIPQKVFLITNEVE